jgi:tetratricopeptide (TPR) repeat protein
MSRGPATHAALKETMQKDPRAFLQLAEEHRRMGRLKDAIEVCLEGLGQHPNLHAASITLGRSYLESGKLDEARSTLEGVCTRLPEHHLAAKLLAETQRRMGDHASAVATCKAILVHYPRDREFEALLAEIAAEQERPAPAAGSIAAGAPAKDAAAPGAVKPGAVTPGATAAGSADPDLEYAPEDVNLPAQPAAPARSPVSATAAKTPERAPSPPPAPAAPRAPAAARAPAPAPAAAATPARDDALQTNTLAELYLKQGFVERAMDVYRAMLRVDATNDRARRRLAELEGAVAAGESPAARRPAVPAPEERETPATASASAPAPDARRATVARLESWRDRIVAGRTEGMRGAGR